MALQEGDLAPDFELPDERGRPIRLSSFRGRKVVLYFYPKDDTPGCTKEACAFRDRLPLLEARGALVLGVSTDDEASHARFKDKYSLPFPLLADKEAKVSRLYGVYKLRSFGGRSFWGIERTTFIIDENGRIAKVFPRVNVDGHVEEVLAALGATNEQPL
ncbi:MAG: thioredoxin-dependent thiol peroxidase [Nitrososphaerota archaeon]